MGAGSADEISIGVRVDDGWRSICTLVGMVSVRAAPENWKRTNQSSGVRAGCQEWSLH